MEPLQQGWLFKKSGGKDGFDIGNLQNKWDRRWFLLNQDGTLSYHKTEKDAAPAGSLDCCNSTLTTLTNPDSNGNGNLFTIKTKDRLITMRAASDDELSSWVKGDAVAGVQLSHLATSFLAPTHVPDSGFEPCGSSETGC